MIDWVTLLRRKETATCRHLLPKRTRRKERACANQLTSTRNKNSSRHLFNISCRFANGVATTPWTLLDWLTLNLNWKLLQNCIRQLDCKQAWRGKISAFFSLPASLVGPGVTSHLRDVLANESRTGNNGFGGHSYFPLGACARHSTSGNCCVVSVLWWSGGVK